jgi:coenzyme F420-reducing hydrogenase delta subunit
MVIEARRRPWERDLATIVKETEKARLTVFHCFNALNDVSFLDSEDYTIQSIKLPCSSLTREVVLLRAFEAGADAVLVFVCPEGSCRYLQGNLRAARRVERVKKILDEIGLDGQRLNLYNIPHGDQQAATHIIERTVAEVARLGRNPAY